MDKLLSYKDIEDITGFKVNFILYDELKDIKRLEDIFKDIYNNCVLILYRTAPRVGHWIGMKKIDNKILFYDSYGEFIDDQLSYTIPYMANLSKLLYNSDYEVHYNNIKLQGEAPICGRYAALFFKYCTNIDLFSNIIKESAKELNISNDELTYLLTK